MIRLAVTATLVAAISSAVGIAAPPAGAVTPTYVSLEFDDAAVSQYTLGWQQALQPHRATGTFFTPTLMNGGSSNFLTVTQISALAAAGNEFGGKAYGTSLVNDTSAQAEVCNNYHDLLSQGLLPVGFAYPNGAYDADTEATVKSCGFGNARTAGGLSATGRTYAETATPVDPYATRAYAPSALTLSNLQSLIAGAAAHGGGWDQIVMRRICSQSLDPVNYSSCTASSGHIELADLNAFLDWIAAAGQPGGAPAGVVLRTLGAMTVAMDTTAPTTTILCNEQACSTGPYTAPVSVTFPATDTYSGVSSTHYTVDGTTPTLGSPAYGGLGPQAFTFTQYLDGPTTVKFRSWDRAGNADAVQSVFVQAPPDTTPPDTRIGFSGAACTCTNVYLQETVSLAATDIGGAGIAHTYYTIDGSTPTTASPLYTAPFTLTTPGTYTVKFFSVDNDGNTETVKSGSTTVQPWTTRVTLSFDNGTASQYVLGWQQALQPHHDTATFYVDTDRLGGGPLLSVAQVQALAAAGNAIGAKTGSTNLTTDPDAGTAVCGDHDALIRSGITPAGFAYPGGAYNTTVENAVAACGWGNARTAGALSPIGPTYADGAYTGGLAGLPPRNWLATKAYAPTGQLTLGNIQSLVTGAANHGGGLVQIVAGKVCSQALDPANYTTCGQSAGHIELADLNAFLDWMANVGKPGGAPLGSTLNTIAQAASRLDASGPNTTVTCNGVPCGPHNASNVAIALSANDSPSGVASTRYTTDGSDPTTTSPLYLTPITLPTGSTVKYRSWDVAGNVEAVRTLVVP
jgi:peptidoglycan/xylan/chitin deacetylase (PgdA/CDA1 family)